MPSVESKGELVEIGLQVPGADAVVNAIKPGLQVRECQVHDRQELLGDFIVAALCYWPMLVSGVA